MATIPVKDGNGNSDTLEKPPSIGQKTSSGSFPVVLPSDQTVPISDATGSSQFTTVQGWADATAIWQAAMLVNPLQTETGSMNETRPVWTARKRGNVNARSSVSCSTTAVLGLAANSSRNFFIVRNRLSVVVGVGLQTTLSSMDDADYTLNPGEILVEDLWHGAVYLILASGTGNVRVSEITNS